MGVTFHPDGGIVIDDREIERDIAEICRITGESPEQAVLISFQELVQRRENRPELPQS
jgi:hypothetical protein